MFSPESPKQITSPWTNFRNTCPIPAQKFDRKTWPRTPTTRSCVVLPPVVQLTDTQCTEPSVMRSTARLAGVQEEAFYLLLALTVTNNSSIKRFGVVPAPYPTPHSHASMTEEHNKEKNCRPVSRNIRQPKKTVTQGWRTPAQEKAW